MSTKCVYSNNNKLICPYCKEELLRSEYFALEEGIVKCYICEKFFKLKKQANFKMYEILYTAYEISDNIDNIDMMKFIEMLKSCNKEDIQLGNNNYSISINGDNYIITYIQNNIINKSVFIIVALDKKDMITFYKLKIDKEFYSESLSSKLSKFINKNILSSIYYTNEGLLANAIILNNEDVNKISLKIIPTESVSFIPVNFKKFLNIYINNERFGNPFYYIEDRNKGNYVYLVSRDDTRVFNIGYYKFDFFNMIDEWGTKRYFKSVEKARKEANSYIKIDIPPYRPAYYPKPGDKYFNLLSTVDVIMSI